MYALAVMAILAAKPMTGRDAGAAKPDATETAKRQGGAHAMSAEVRGLFGQLIDPVGGVEAHWSMPVFDRRSMSEVFLVTIEQEIPKSIAGVQISRLSAGYAGKKGFVVVGSGGVHLILVHPSDDHVGVFGGSYCRPGVGGLALGNDGAIDRGACWKEALGRFEIKMVHLPQPH